MTTGTALRTSAAWIMAIPIAAWAQDDSRTYVLDPVVIYAGQPKVASEVPQSVTVVGPDQIAEIAPGTIGDILAVVPGVAGTGSGSFFGQGFNIRGFGTTSSAASESGIVQLIDGEEKYYESYRQGSLFVEPDFLRQVQVLRGPGSSTLYGSGALGGVIAMETIEASDLIAEGATQGGRVKLGYASNPDTWTGSIMWGWRPTADFEALAAFAYRDLGDTKDADGNVTIRTNSRTPNVLLKAKQTLGDHYVAFSYQHLEAKGDNQDFNQLDGAQAGLFPGFAGWGLGDITTRDQVARLVWGYNPQDNRLVDLTATLSYTNTMKDVRQGDDPSEPIMSSLLGERDYKLWKLKLRNVSDLSTDSYDHFLTTGIEGLKQDRSSSVPSSSHPEAYTRALSAYAWSEFSWDRLTINTGLRYEKQRTEPKSTVTVTDDKVSAEAIEPQIGVIYRLNDQFSVFGSYAYVNRLPTVDELYDGFNGRPPNPGLKDEKGRNIEIGMGYRNAGVLRGDDELVAKLTMFRNNISNMISRPATSAPPTVPGYINIDRAYLRGGELEASYRSGAFDFGAAVSVVNGYDQDGDKLTSLPNNRVVLSASWRVNDDWKLGLRSTLADGRDKPDGGHRGGYGLHDIYAMWTPQSGPAAGIQVHAGIDNLTDRDYQPATWTDVRGPGRNFKLSVARSF